MAHVGAVGEVVGTVRAGKQLPHERGFQRGAARGVEDHAVGRQGAQLRADLAVGLLPFHSLVMTAGGVEAQRMGQAPVALQVVVAPVAQFADRVPSEEIRPGLLGRQLPGRGLGAVLAKLQRVGIAGLGPGAADTGKAIRLVLLEQGQRGLGEGLLAPENVHHRERRAPASGGVSVGAIAGCLGMDDVHVAVLVT